MLFNFGSLTKCSFSEQKFVTLISISLHVNGRAFNFVGNTVNTDQVLENQYPAKLFWLIVITHILIY